MTVVGPAGNEIQRIAPDVKVDGSPLAARWLERLLEVRVQRGLRTIGRATLTFADPGYTLLSAGVFSIGTTVSLTSAEVGNPVLLTGAVTAVASQTTRRDGALATVTLQDKAVELTREPALTTFANVSLSDVVTQLARARAVSVNVPATSGTHEYTLRNDTVLGLIDEIALREGLDWEVHDDTLNLWKADTGTAPGTSPVTLRLGEDLLEFSVRQVGAGSTTVTVRGWDRTTQQDVTASATTPASRAAFAVGGTQWQEKQVDAHAPVTSQDAAQGLATARAVRTGRVGAQGRALFTAGLRPGGTVTIENTGPSGGSYYVREVTHVFDRTGTRTLFAAGDRDPVRLSDPWDSPQPASSFVRSGVFTAIVDKVENENDGKGLVSVTLPALGSAPASSAWARVLSPGAGAQRGTVVLPEVGDEVLVVFEDGDVTRPVVLGGLFGGNQTLPAHVVRNGAVVTRGFTSRKGHRVLLSDGDGEDDAFIELALAGDQHSLRIVKNGATLTVPSGKPLKLAAGNASIEIDAQGKITLKGQNIALEATQAVEVKGTSITEKATGQLQLDGAQTTVKASGTASLESGGPVTVKGMPVAIN